MTLTGPDAHRERILKAALALLRKDGRDALTTRNVADAAKVQPPVLYRLFGDKTGLLDAVAAFGFASYLSKKGRPASHEDPVEALRAGWDLHVSFGLANPELYLLMYANPRPGAESPAAQEAFALLHQHMQRVAAAGQLRVSVARACALYHAAASGVVMSLLATSPEQRDASLSPMAREHALTGITTRPAVTPSSGIVQTANALRATLMASSAETQGITSAERRLLFEWLDRLANPPTQVAGAPLSKG